MLVTGVLVTDVLVTGVLVTGVLVTGVLVQWCFGNNMLVADIVLSGYVVF